MVQLSHPRPLLPGTGKRLRGIRGLKAFCLKAPSVAGCSSGEVLALVGIESTVPPRSRELLVEDGRKGGAEGAGSRRTASKSPTLEDMDSG